MKISGSAQRRLLRGDGSRPLLAKPADLKRQSFFSPHLSGVINASTGSASQANPEKHASLDGVKHRRRGYDSSGTWNPGRKPRVENASWKDMCDLYVWYVRLYGYPNYSWRRRKTE